MKFQSIERNEKASEWWHGPMVRHEYIENARNAWQGDSSHPVDVVQALEIHGVKPYIYGLYLGLYEG